MTTTAFELRPSHMAGLVACAVGVGAVAGAIGIGLFVRKHLPDIVQDYEHSHLTQYGRDMATYYAALGHDKYVVPCRLRDTTISTLCGYNPTGPQLPSLASFTQLKRQVDCLFAKNSRIWGAAPWDEKLSLEENVCQSLEAFTLFMSTQRSIDGFVFEIPTPGAGDTVEIFGETVRRVLTALSDADPDGWHCMSESFVGNKGWVFRYNKEEAFVTSFAPCYPATHSRYNFGLNTCFVLFQPYSSFLTHNVGSDSPHTNWKKPQNMRERIRCNFFGNGRPYLIREIVAFPIVEDIVKPLELTDEPLPWFHPPPSETAARCPVVAQQQDRQLQKQLRRIKLQEQHAL